MSRYEIKDDAKEIERAITLFGFKVPPGFNAVGVAYERARPLPSGIVIVHAKTSVMKLAVAGALRSIEVQS